MASCGNLDDFLPNVVTQDTHKRMQAHSDLVAYLSDPMAPLECSSLDEFIDGLTGWVGSSNFKISINGLEVLCLMVDRMGEDFRHHIQSVLPYVVDRLGDSKDQVREQAQQLLLKLMMPASNPQYVFERMMGAFTHKLWHVREGVLICLQNTLNRYGARCLSLSKIVPSICKLLEDQSGPVREAAVNTLAEIYRHVGEKVRQDLGKKSIPQARLNQLFAKFDEVKHSGNMLATADLAPTRGERSEDETDFARPTSTKVPQTRRLGSTSSTTSGTGRKSSAAGRTSTSAHLVGRKKKSMSAGTSAGAVDEDLFIKSFEDVPKVQLFSSRDLQELMNKMKDTLSDPNTDYWERRVEALKTFRAIILAGGAQQDEFYQLLRMLEPCINLGVKDLRSQVVREACISIAYASQQLGQKVDRFAESVFQNLINLIPNSAKIMATSGIVCIRFIVQYTHAPRIIPIITGNLTSKSNIIRRYCYELMNQFLQQWATHTLEKHIAIIQEGIKRGISDADSEARVFARKSFWGFSEHFKDQADALFNAMEPSKQKALQGELGGSSSNSSINSSDGTKSQKMRARSASQDRTTFDSSTLGRIGRKSYSRFSSARSDTGGANSRSGSPSSRQSYITHTSGRTDPMTPSRTRRSGIPRSQGASRESSPNRVSHMPGRERRLSGSKTNSGLHPKAGVQRHLRPSTDVEDHIADALRQPLRRRYESYDSDDAASETSSVCSERSYSSYSRTSEDMSEILSLMTSGSYADRKEGLICLQNILRQNRYLNRVELKKITEVFTRMFHDPHSKVLSLFLETLVDLVTLHNRDLQDWLYVLLTRLLNKTGTEMLGSVNAKVQRALDAVRDNFPCDHQFNLLTKFIVDQTQSPNLKVKISMLNYMHGLVLSMDPTDFVNSGDTRLAVSRIITWTTEPKSVDVRKASQSVLIALFNLNAPEFSMMLSVLPKAFQDGATKILHNHIRSSSGEATDVLGPRNVTSPQPQQRSRPPSRTGHRDITDTENMNPEDIYNSIKKTSADIQNLSFNSKLDHYDVSKKKLEFTSQDSGIQDLRNDSPDAVDGKKPHYNPTPYQDEGTMNGYNKAALAEAVFDGDNEFFNQGLPLDQDEVIQEILTELSNHNERQEERKNAMLSLIKLTRDGAFSLWDEHFKSILLILLETLGDDDGHIRALALRVLREILRNQPTRFREYAELTILRILEAHKDPIKEVVRSAEECAATLANYIPAEQTVRILNPIIQTAQFPTNLAAIKMQTKVVELIPSDVLKGMLSEIMPGVLRGYDDNESSVRKASVFCLVAIYCVVGEVLRPHLTELNGSKIKLLNLYIKRAQAQKDGAKGFVSPSSSDT